MFNCVKKIPLVFTFTLGTLNLLGQQISTPLEQSNATADSTKIEIISADRLTLLKTDDSTSLQLLAGHVKLKQGKAFFFCDSCVLNNSKNYFEAWQNIQLKDGDSIQVNAKHLRYLIDQKLAWLDGGVKLSDQKAVLTTPSLEYNLNTDIGKYTQGGRVVNKKTILTSTEGYYYAALKEIYFKKKVTLTDPAYTIKTDSLLYNSATQTNRFIAQTVITDSTGRTIETKEGYYRNGKAEFGLRPIVRDGATTVIGDRIAFNDSLGTSQAVGNVIVTDTAQGTTLITNQLFRENKDSRTLATGKPLLIIKQENDSLFLTADTIYSANHSAVLPLHTTKDSMPLLKEKSKITGTKKVTAAAADSALRYIEAFHHVKIFSDSLQAVCDSLYYSDRDSAFRLFYNPILWSKENQITGDTIWLHTKNRKADKLMVFENSLLISEVEKDVYNQIGATRMEGLFTAGNLDSVRATGNASTIYFLQNEDSAYTGINESKSDLIDIYFKERELHRVVMRSTVVGTVWPIQQKNPITMRLPHFSWEANKRPRSKLDLLE
jgi:lipopolysaccharide export system protein LptA